jgi:ArsR family transcriptional regulator, arsenate/arsenite/antimonite-responsive transcriptional repressor
MWAYPEVMAQLEDSAVSVVDDECCAGADCELMPRAEAETLAVVLRALADPTRVRLLQYLAESESGTACACHLPDALGITQPTLSHHMRKLHDAGLVERERRGRWVHYTVQPEAMRQVRAFLELPVRGAAERCC